MPKLQLSGMFQQQQQPPPDLLTAQLLLSTKKQSPTTSFVDKIVSKVTTGVLPMLARMSGQGGSSSNSSALTSVVNSRHASVQSSAANSARMNEPSSNAASAQTSSHDSIMISEILSKQSYNGGTVTPDESSPPKPRSGMVSRASLTQLSSLSSPISRPQHVEAEDNSSALTSVVNSRHASVQSSAANSARMNEPSSSAAKHSYNGGTVTPDESSPPKPRSGMVSRASLTQLSSLSSPISRPQHVEAEDNSSALTSVVNSRHASVQSSAANSARMNEPSSSAAKHSYNGGTVTPDESSPPKPRSGMVSRASLTQLSSLSSQASQPHVVAGGVGGGSTAPTPSSSTTQSVFMSKSKSRSRFDQAHANGHNPSQSPFVTTDDGQTPPPTSATSSSSPGSPTIVVRASFPNMTMTPRSKKEGGGGMSLPPIMSARSTISAVPSNPSIASST